MLHRPAFIAGVDSTFWFFYPIINYLGYFQRRVGCFGAGDRFFYIDTDGDAHICPFCTKKIASALHFSANDMVDLLSKNACFDFNKGGI